MEEGIIIARRLWTEESVTHAGRYYQLREARVDPKPVQQPHPPICIGGGGEKRTLRAAAKYAQHWNLAGGTPDVFAHKLGVLHEHCAAIGRDPKEIMTSTQLRLLGDGDPKEVAAQASQFADVGCDMIVVYLAPHDPAMLEPLANALAPLT
jgi:alkanesulfonate monooxygenase SsuD/methylene tetrahydromethanopterin reductase-like flavin-dependent oxidoreductase (luciferase family)